MKWQRRQGTREERSSEAAYWRVLGTPRRARTDWRSSRGDERQISRRLTAGLVQRSKRAGASWQMSSLWNFFFFGLVLHDTIAFDAFPTELQLEWPDYLLNDRDHFSSWQFWCLQNIATRPWDNLHAWCSFLNPWSCIMVCKYASKSQAISRL